MCTSGSVAEGVSSDAFSLMVVLATLSCFQFSIELEKDGEDGEDAEEEEEEEDQYEEDEE